MDLAYTLIQDPDAVEMALWFHDAIYIPRSSENEKESAELFVRDAGDHFRPSFIRKVYELILVTAHKELAQECNKQFIADIDLSSFGVDWEEFLRDTKAVRREQADSSDAVPYSDGKGSSERSSFTDVTNSVQRRILPVSSRILRAKDIPELAA
jgi:predicted metal-dependent HD superfamily phosphohydrolase